VTTHLTRSSLEAIVRDVVLRRLGDDPGTAAGLRRSERAPGLVVNVSARHMHVSQQDLERLFGPGATLTPHKALYQPGQFAARETVTLIGPRSRPIPNLRILGPVRKQTQVELAFTDAVLLGIENLPLRMSGETSGTPGAYLMGPAGLVVLQEGVIRAVRHVHMTPDDAATYGVQNGDPMRLRVGGEAGVVLERVVARVDPAARLEVHIDTDEANACALHLAKDIELTT
jgi:putative phosphotransacetylase